MNHRAILTALVAAAALTAAPASAQNLSGMWQFTSEGRRGPQTQTITLAVEGSTLTGTITFTGGGRRGGGGGTPQAIEISDGTVDGNSFTFTVTRSFGGNSFSQVYSGTIEGDAIAGTIDSGRGDHRQRPRRCRKAIHGSTPRLTGLHRGNFQGAAGPRAMGPAVRRWRSGMCSRFPNLHRIFAA